MKSMKCVLYNFILVAVKYTYIVYLEFDIHTPIHQPQFIL